MHYEYYELMKQASYMQKVARALPDGFAEMDDYDRIYALDFPHDTDLRNPKYRQLEQAYMNQRLKFEEETPYQSPERTLGEKIKQYAYPTIGVGTGLAGSYGAMRFKKWLDSPGTYRAPYKTMIASPLLGGAIGLIGGNVGYLKRDLEGNIAHQREMQNKMKQTNVGQKMQMWHETLKEEQNNHPEVKAFIERYGYNPFEETFS